MTSKRGYIQMKFRTFSNLTKDGIVNVYRQKMMSVATICIIVASFLVLGIFLLMILNLAQLSAVVSKEPEIRVSCKHTLDDGQVYSVEAALKAFEEFTSVTRISKEQSLQKIKDDVYQGSADSLKGLSPDFLPVVFIIKLKDPTQGASIIPKLQAVKGVGKVTSPLEIVNLILSAQESIKVISIFLLTILMAISVLIMSNAIKLTVHSRRRDITIMKYIGATDSFIKMPFIIEGIIMGLIGSTLSFVLVGGLYNLVLINTDKISNTIVQKISLVKLDDIVNFSLFGLVDIKLWLGFILILVFIFTGMLIGAIGSAISIKKYLKLK